MADRLKLYVEGRDDRAVVYGIAQFHQFSPLFEVEEYDAKGEAIYGIDGLKKKLPVLLKVADFDRLGVLVDADEDLGARWQSLKQIFANAGYVNLPDAPERDGTVVDHQGLPRVGIWIMPDNASAGMLEDFVSAMIPSSDTLLDQARKCLDHIPLDERRFSHEHHTKALIHTWLAWQKTPGTPQGLAIKRQYLDPECPAALKLLGWLTRLFA